MHAIFFTYNFLHLRSFYLRSLSLSLFFFFFFGNTYPRNSLRIISIYKLIYFPFSLRGSCSSVTELYPFFVTPRTAAGHASLYLTLSWSLLKFMCIELVMLSNHLIICWSLLLFAFNLSQHQGLFQWVGSSPQVAKVLELQLQHQSFRWIFRADFL